MNIILGSQSKARAKVLADAGIVFTQMSADIDEKAIRHEDPRELTRLLSHAKADALVAGITEPSFLITSDQVVAWNGKILEKPVDAAEERLFLKGYEAHPAETVTSVVVTNTQTGTRVEGTDVVRVFFKPIPTDVVDQLIAEKNCFTQAGGFGIQDPLVWPYIIRVEGEVESVMGLPKMLTLELLRKIKEIS